MDRSRNSFKLQAMTFITDKDLQEKERKVYSPEYHFGNAWTSTTSMPYAKMSTLASNPYLAEGAYSFGLPGLAIGGVLWIDNNRIFFTDLRKGQISTLRLRVSPHMPFCALGAYWLPREERLVIHDIYKFGGENVWQNMKFSERWCRLGQLQKMILQDVDLQGFTLELADLGNVVDGTEIMIIQPEKAGARSFRIHGIPAEAAVAAAPSVVPEVTEQNTSATQLWIAKDVGRTGPEAYILLDAGGVHCGIPAIQGLAISQAIRNGLMKAEKFQVRVRWNVHFGRYEVLGGSV